MAESTTGHTTAIPASSQIPDILRAGFASNTTVPHTQNGHASGVATHIPAINDLPPYLTGVLPSGVYPLSGISLRANLLGLALGVSSSLAVFHAYNDNPLWRAPFFVGSLALFHFLEFYMTALYNTPRAKIEAFLLSQNGSAYNAAHTLAMLETVVAHWFRLYEGIAPEWITVYLIAIGLGMMLVGQIVRSMAMAQAGTNFNHTVQVHKNKGHQLVTSGIYGWLRHPSYFGFFWWGLGTQVVLGNLVCFIAYAGILWKFFQMRIKTEEQYLIRFFGEDYVAYKKKTGVGIPFIS